MLLLGEELLCKMDYVVYDICYLNKNKIYIIDHVYDNDINMVSIYSGENTILRFTLNKNVVSIHYLWNYFYSPEEIRLLKIESL